MKSDLAYTAGVIDGEGCLSVHHSRNRRYGKTVQIQLVVVNTHKPLVTWLRKNFGGSIRSRRREESHHKNSWSWCLSSVPAAALLTSLLPHLIVKRQEAKLFIRLVRMKQARGTRPRTPGVVRTHERIRERMAALKNREWQ